MIALDTNLLAYAHRSATAEHQSAQKAIEKAVAHPSGWGIPLPCVAEFWMVVTHPSCRGGPSSSALARRFLTALIDSGNGQIWHPAPGFGLRLAHAASAREVSGARIFDLQIAMIAAENGATQLWTHDKAFVAVPGLRVIDPL
jgi:predicted nucleic acid-binding protein